MRTRLTVDGVDMDALSRVTLTGPLDGGVPVPAARRRPWWRAAWAALVRRGR